MEKRSYLVASQSLSEGPPSPFQNEERLQVNGVFIGTEAEGTDT